VLEREFAMERGVYFFWREQTLQRMLELDRGHTYLQSNSTMISSSSCDICGLWLSARARVRAGTQQCLGRTD
jgi:hypothetical protein